MRFSPAIQRAIDALADKGVYVRHEFGGRHIKLFLGNKLVGIHPRSLKHVSGGAADMNIAAQIKRAAREIGVDI